MKKILTMVVVASLLMSPALAFAGPDGPEKPKKVDLRAAAKVAATDIVFRETNARPLEESAPPQEGGVAQGKLWAGIGMIALGAGLIWKGADLHTDEPDPFGRKKNADAYLAIGVGSVITFFGVMATRGGLAGRGFDQ